MSASCRHDGREASSGSWERPPVDSALADESTFNTGDRELVRLAREVPGGFAGIYLDSNQNVVLLLKHPEKSEAVIAALSQNGAVYLPAPIQSGTVTIKRAKWDFAELFDWSRYVTPRVGVTLLTFDLDEVNNRIALGVAPGDLNVARDNLRRLHLPPGLVSVEAESPVCLDDVGSICGQEKNRCDRLPERTNLSQYHQDVVNLQGCAPGVAIPALLREWLQPPADTTAIRVLAGVTGKFRDQRLLAAVLRTASDATLSRDVRVQSFHALVSYVDPRATVMFRQLDRDGLRGGRYVSIGTLDHPTSEDGPEPLGTSTASDIIRFFTDVGASDPDATVRTIGAYLAERLAAKGR